MPVNQSQHLVPGRQHKILGPVLNFYSSYGPVSQKNFSCQRRTLNPKPLFPEKLLWASMATERINKIGIQLSFIATYSTAMVNGLRKLEADCRKESNAVPLKVLSVADNETAT